MMKRTLLAGFAALSMGGATLTATTPAQAQVYFSTGYSTGSYWGGSPYYGGYRGYRSVGYYPRHGYYHGGYPYRYRRSNGGAVAAGLIGGLALGALAATAARPAYYYPTTVASSCWIERQRVRDRYGRILIRNVQVCG